MYEKIKIFLNIKINILKNLCFRKKKRKTEKKKKETFLIVSSRFEQSEIKKGKKEGRKERRKCRPSYSSAEVADILQLRVPSGSITSV